MIGDPYYDEDLINKGYLDKILGNTSDIIENDISITKNYGTQPPPPYKIGDTWTSGSTVYTCITPREIGEYTASDWTTESGAIALAQNAFNIANEKSRMYLIKPVAYNTNDMWTLENDTVHSKYKKGAILVSITSRHEPDIFNEDDWIKFDSYPTEDKIVIINSNIAEANIKMDNINLKVQENTTAIDINTNEIEDTKSIVTEIDLAVGNITQKVNTIYDFAKTVTGTNQLTLIDAVPTNILKFIANAKKPNTLFPSITLFPSSTLFPRKRGTSITVVIDRNDRSLQSSESIELPFYFREPLREYGICDQFIIEFSENKSKCIIKIVRKLKIVDGIILILDIPIEEILLEREIKLFKGNNYIYIKQHIDWNLEAQYISDNDLNKYFASKVEMSTKIAESSDNILIEVAKKVDDDKIVASINLSPEIIKIIAAKLALEGYTTINGTFTVDNEGNVRIANDAVVIDEQGITLANGARIIGTSGLLSVFQYDSGNWEQVGYEENPGYSHFIKTGLDLSILIPNNIEIVSAIIELQHSPQYLSNLPNDSGFSTPFTSQWCYVRNLKAYIYNSSNFYRYGIFASEWITNPNLALTEILGALGSTGFTATPPSVVPGSNPQNVVQTVASSDIKSSLVVGKYNDIRIETGDAVPNYTTDWKSGYLKTALCRATLTIIGFKK